MKSLYLKTFFRRYCHHHSFALCSCFCICRYLPMFCRYKHDGELFCRCPRFFLTIFVFFILKIRILDLYICSFLFYRLQNIFRLFLTQLFSHFGFRLSFCLCASLCFDGVHRHRSGRIHRRRTKRSDRQNCRKKKCQNPYPRSFFSCHSLFLSENFV